MSGDGAIDNDHRSRSVARPFVSRGRRLPSVLGSRAAGGRARRLRALTILVAAVAVMGAMPARAVSGSAPRNRCAVPAIAQPAVAHRAGGLPVRRTSVPAACGYATPWLGNEPTLGIDRGGAVYLWPADAHGIATSTSEGQPPEGRGAAMTADGGAHWSRVVPSAAGVPTHVLDPNVDLDPYFYVDPTTSRIFASSLSPTVHCSNLSFSDDRGQTWTHTLAGCAEADHPTIFAGPAPATSTHPLNYPDVTYYCGLNTVATALASTSTTCEKSLDGGQSWVPTGSPAYIEDPSRPSDYGLPGGFCSFGTGHGIVASDGTIYLPKGWCGQPYLAISQDEGLTWRHVQVNAGLGVPIGSFGSYAGDETGVGVDAAGNLYYAWIAHDRLPYLTISRDRGATWGPPQMIGAPGLNETWSAQLIVGAPGRLAFAYMGTTDGPGAPFPNEIDDCKPTASVTRPVDCVSNGGNANSGATTSEYANATWSGYMMETTTALTANPVFFTAAVNPVSDPLIRGSCGPGPAKCGPAADFLDVRIAPDGTPWAAFIDGCTGDCAAGTTLNNNDSTVVAGHLIGGQSLLATAAR